MANINYDSNDIKERFQNGLDMSMIQTKENELTEDFYLVQRFKCCSTVKTTQLNWFYLIPKDRDTERLVQWIEEIAPLFPHFNLGIERIPKKDLTVLCTVSPEELNYVHSDRNYKVICLEVPVLSNFKSPHTSHRSSFTDIGYIDSLNFVVNSLVEYCIDNYHSTVDTKIISSFIDSYFDSFIDNLLTKSNVYSSYLKSSTSNNATKLYVDLGKCVDATNISKDKLIKYLEEVTDLNSVLIDKYIKTHAKDLASNKHIIIRALYKQKKNPIEPYLLHHLIRAGVSNNFEYFINQYFIIKESTPELDFWNRIMITQFGFKYYYYYWLTGARTFNFIKPEVFQSRLRTYRDYSTKDFFGDFETNYSTTVLNSLITLYKKGDFETFVEIIKGTTYVSLKTEAKNKFINLRLRDEYKSSTFDEKYYFIVGDDYVLRRYSKTNFNIINKV